MNRLSKAKGLFIVVVFGVIGSAWLLVSQAATIANSVQPETGSLSGEASALGDTSASGNQAIKFADSSTTTGPKIDTRNAVLDSSNKILPWTTPRDKAYSTVAGISWNYLLNTVPNDPNTGKPAYYSRSYMDPSTGDMAGWPSNPAGMNAMLIESAIGYYQFTGNNTVIQLAKNIADHHLGISTTVSGDGMTTASDDWANVPYSSGNGGSLTYRGSSQLPNGAGDGTGNLEPDKVGEFGYALILLYQQTGKVAYRDAAINAANALASHIRTGSATQSPWGFRVNAHTGAINEQYGSNVIRPIELFDELIRLNLGNVSNYQTARAATWSWLMQYPISNNKWSGYYEDVPKQNAPDSNLSSITALNTARYLLLHPETDANWEAHVRSILAWTELKFKTVQFGANTIREQLAFDYPMGSHTSDYADVNALLYQKTGDATAKEKAYRAFNWATYMARDTGIVIDGPTVPNGSHKPGTQWFTDGYGDYVRHFMAGIGAVPEWSPASENHLVQSNTVVKSVSYNAGNITYQTFDNSSIESFRVKSLPASVTAGGTALPKRNDLNQAGWTYNAGSGVLAIRHNAADVIVNF